MILGEPAEAPAYRRCENFAPPAGCNWLVPAEAPTPLCITCRLNRIIPDLSDLDNCRYWRSFEIAKRRLVSPLLWRDRHISSYASVHPWEDWAECFAH